MIVHYQSITKRHIDFMNQNANGNSPSMKNLRVEWKTIDSTSKIQLKINGKDTNYEPKTVIDPPNLNKKRTEVGLGTIEEAILVMNRNFQQV